MEHQINEEIRDREVRLIDADGNQVGIVPIAKAQEAASSKNLDLVKIAGRSAGLPRHGLRQVPL